MAKRLEFAVSVDRERAARPDRGGAALPEQDGWTPEHLVLAALARCVLTSLDFHAERAGLELEASAEASGAVSAREDGGWGFVELVVAVDASLSSVPAPDELRALVARARRGCFVGASLVPTPAYRFVVNGEEVG